ncbi:MAG: hypothetical protein KDB21_20515, partial [Acidimicrobiales bacterium]|nr:hypothetical protein [Acidimicrobiales bacterium]
VDGQNLVYTSLDSGATWSVADLSGLLAQQASGGSVWSYGAEVGPLGIGVIIGTDDGAGGFEYALAFSPDGTTWTVTDQAQLEAAAGVEVASIDWILVGEDQVVVNGTVSAERNADGNLPLFVVAGVPST